MAQKGQKQEGMSCGEVFAVCVASTHKGIAPHPYTWQQHVANQCRWRVHYLSEQTELY